MTAEILITGNLWGDLALGVAIVVIIYLLIPPMGWRNRKKENS